MAYSKGSDPTLSGYTLSGIYTLVAERQQTMADAPDPRVFLADEGPARDRLIEQDRQRCAIDATYRRSKCTLDIDRLDAGLPILLPRGSIDTRRWREAKLWPEIRERSVEWFEMHPDDRVVPVPGAVDPQTYWG